MKKISALTLIFILPVVLYAQETEWASRVISYSTQLSDYAYAATQILGKPNVLPKSGDNPNAWMPARPDRISEIKVGFDHPLKVQQIAVAESFNPGSVYRIFLYDVGGNEHLIVTLNPHVINNPSRLMNVYINETTYDVNAVKIVLDCSAVPGYNAIDAIGISGSKEPIKVITNVAFRRNPDQRTDMQVLDNVNDSSESRPVRSDLLDVLYFTRKYHPGNIGGTEDPEDVWYATINRSTGQLADPVNIGKVLNNEGPNTLGSIAMVDGKISMILGNASGKNGKLQTGAYYSQWNGSEWAAAEELKIKNAHIGSWDADYFLTEDGSLLFIATERFDTEGGKDLYVSMNDGKGRFSEPLNLGRKLNSAGDEECPFYDGSGKVLYYATSGLTGFGNFDIFKTTPLDSTYTNWSEPQNIGSDINSPANDKYFSFARNGKFAYFVRDDSDNHYKIFKVPRPQFMTPTPLVTIKGNLTDKSDNSPLNGQVSFLLLPEQAEYGVTVSDETTGNYEMLIPSGNTYQVKATSDGYDSAIISVSLENKNRAYGYTLPLALDKIRETLVASADTTHMTVKPAETGKIITAAVKKPRKMDYDTTGIDEVEFPFNSDVPINASLAVIDKYISWLKENKDVKVEIAGFTDPIGDEKYNVDLSLRRAAWVKHYMIQKGISSRRIKSIAFGEKMLVSMEKGSTFRLNRRVEFNFTMY
jgi:OmpA-OmpF porin, OOP family